MQPLSHAIDVRDIVKSIVRAILVACALTIAIGSPALASEFGVSSYRPGLMDLFAGYLAPPGSTVIKHYFMFQDGSAAATTTDGQFRVRAHTVTYTDTLFAAHVTGLNILGSYWAFGVIGQTRTATQSLHLGPRGHMQHQTDSASGIGDLIVAPWLMSWSYKQFHLMNSLMLYTPTGDYDSHRIINLGTNRWAIEPDLGLTWMNEETGRQCSVFLGYTINTTNTESHYRSGDEFHADFALAQHLRNGLAFGMVGYALQQTTPDSGNGAVFGSYEGRVLALGPMLSATVKVLHAPITITFKYDFEFAAQNRLSGNELWLTASLRL